MTVPNGENANGVRGSTLMHSGRDDVRRRGGIFSNLQDEELSLHR